MKKTIYLLFLISVLFNSLSFGHSGRTNSSGCHNNTKTGGYHCHNGGSSSSSSSDYEYDYTDYTTREMSDNEIVEYLKAGRKTYNISNSKDKARARELKRKGDIYSEDEILKKLKETKSCKSFHDFSHNYSECKSLLETNRIYGDKEIQDVTNNYNSCNNIKTYKTDYTYCNRISNEIKKDREIKNNEITKKRGLTRKQIGINSRINDLYIKNPNLVEKLLPAIESYKNKINVNDDARLLLDGMSKQIRILLNKKNNFENIQVEKNNKIKSFSSSKKLLEEEIYNDLELSRLSFYCGCDYSASKLIDNDICGYEPNDKYLNRSNKIEWEHVVPASKFGNHFEERTKGDEDCIDSNGESYTGRRCAEKTNENYQIMQADMYNLVPSIGSINALRSNYGFSIIPGEEREFGACDIEIENSLVEPKPEIRGDIARIYMYMDLTYTGYDIISNEKKELLNEWNNQDLISLEECNRYEQIKSIQGNENAILNALCN